MQKNKLFAIVSQQDIKLSMLLFLWILGLISGALAGCFSSADPIWMLRTLSVTASFSSLFFCALIPFVLSVGAVFFRKSRFIYFLVAVKAFTFSYIGCVCLVCFAGSGWLVRLFFLFTQIATVPALWYLWLCYCQGKHKLTYFSFSAILLYVSLIAMLDHYWFAPALLELSV